MRELIELVIGGTHQAFRPVRRTRGHQESDCYDLVSPDGHDSGLAMSEAFYLKDVTETRTATGYGGNVRMQGRTVAKGRAELKLLHMQAKFDALKRLGIRTEPLITAFVEDGVGYVITGKVGRSLDEIRRKEPHLFARHAPFFYEGVCRIIGTLHAHNFIHGHPHLGNFTFDDELHLIDIGRVKRLRTLNWYDPLPFLMDDLRTLFFAFRTFAQAMGKDSDHIVLQGLLLVMEHWPVPRYSRYMTLQKFFKEWKNHAGLKPNANIYMGDPAFRQLHDLIREYQKEGCFKGAWH